MVKALYLVTQKRYCNRCYCYIDLLLSQRPALLNATELPASHEQSHSEMQTLCSRSYCAVARCPHNRHTACSCLNTAVFARVERAWLHGVILVTQALGTGCGIYRICRLVEH